ncbi:hypothetical protein [Nocardia sp. NPDC048505]|uniref:DUF7373 family lipoprotein n=1 Tax=unclassified Nocardia TaxID=2637762 RepID=UPI0033D535C2
MTPVDLAILKTGPHLREPSEFDPDINTIGDLRRLEARRMLNNLALPTDIDSEISEVGTVELFTHATSPWDLSVLPEKYQPAAVDNNLLVGAYVSRINESLRKRKKLIISLLRFPTAAQSQKAAADFDAITNAENNRHPLVIEGYPEARTSSADDVTSLTFMPRDNFVVLVNAGVPQPDPAALATVVKKTIDRQLTLLRDFRPMPFDDLLDIPIDPDSILRRALPKSPDNSDPFLVKWDFGAMSPAAELHYERNPLAVKAAFEASGVDLIGRRGGIVYRTRDLPGAYHLQSVLVKTGKNDEVLPAPPGLPDTRCIRLDVVDEIRNFDEMCAVIRGRYVALVFTKSRIGGGVNPDLYQRAAAQYSILANSE